MATQHTTYPVTFNIAYPDNIDRMTAFFRLLLSIPIFVIFCILTSGDGAAGSGLFVATALMILFRQKYPRWWFDYVLELNRFSIRVSAYMLLLTHSYPSTTDRQAVQLDITYPAVQQDLNRWLPVIKWLLAIPHYVIMAFLVVAAAFVSIVAWFAILFTGRYPRPLFEFVVGVARWCTRVNAYAFLLVTDQYPPFSLK